MKRLTTLLTTSVLCSFLSAISLANDSTATSMNSQAKPQWYQIDMIIFSQLDLGQHQDENWPYVAPFSLPDTPTISLTPPALYQAQQQPITSNIHSENSLTTTQASYPLVPGSSFQLQSEALHLMHGQHYKIIGQLAWLQPIAQNNVPIHIQAANEQTLMDGLVTLTKKHFIQLHLNAIFSTALSAFMNPNDNLKTLASQDGQVRFQLIQSVRMRTHELDYIDFPFYGILVEITPHSAPGNATPTINVNPA